MGSGGVLQGVVGAWGLVKSHDGHAGGTLWWGKFIMGEWRACEGSKRGDKNQQVLVPCANTSPRKPQPLCDGCTHPLSHPPRGCTARRARG